MVERPEAESDGTLSEVNCLCQEDDSEVLLVYKNVTP